MLSLNDLQRKMRNIKASKFACSPFDGPPPKEQFRFNPVTIECFVVYAGRIKVLRQRDPGAAPQKTKEYKRAGEYVIFLICFPRPVSHSMTDFFPIFDPMLHDQMSAVGHTTTYCPPVATSATRRAGPTDLAQRKPQTKWAHQLLELASEGLRAYVRALSYVFFRVSLFCVRMTRHWWWEEA